MSDAELDATLDKAHKTMAEMAASYTKSWRMSIPADPVNDTDLIICGAIRDAKAAITEFRARVAVLEAAVRWALGEGDSDFGDDRPENASQYWWRTELRKRAALTGASPAMLSGEEVRETAAKIIEANQEATCLKTAKRKLVERIENDQCGLAFAAAIRSIPLTRPEPADEQA